MPAFRHLLVVAVLSAGLPAYATLPHGSIANSDWILREIDGRPVAHGPVEAARLVFGANHQIGGSAGCNSFVGNAIRWSSDRSGARGTFRFRSRVGMPWTLMDCQPSPAERDGAAFWQKMRQPASWSASATQLTITFSDGGIARLAPAPRR